MSVRQPLHILFVTPWYPTVERTHSGSFVQEFVKIVQQCHQVTVLHALAQSSDWGNGCELEKEENEELTTGVPTYRLHYQWSLQRAKRFVRSTCLFRALQKLIREVGKPDVIHAHVHSVAQVAVLFGKLYRIPVVVHEHNSIFLKPKLPYFEKLTANYAFTHADAFLPVSHALQQAIDRHGIHCEFEVVPNVVDMDMFSSSFAMNALTSKVSDQPSRPVISAAKQKKLLCVANMPDSEVKGYRYLIQALTKLRNRTDWQLDIIGDGPKRAVYTELVKQAELADRIHFHGFQPKAVVAEAMQHADIFVLASLWETMGCVLIEALAAGLPIVATRTGGIPEIVTSECGMLVEPKDAQSLADALTNMLDNYTTFSPLALRHIAEQKYSYTAVGAQLNRIYHTVLAKTEHQKKATVGELGR